VWPLSRSSSVAVRPHQRPAGNADTRLLHRPAYPQGVPGGGVLNAIIGTFEIVGIGSLLAVPAALIGIFLSEYGRNQIETPSVSSATSSPAFRRLPSASSATPCGG